MDPREYKELMKMRLLSAFDVREAPKSLGIEPDLWAVHNRSTDKYIFSKKVTLYSMKNDEYVCLVRLSEPLTAELLEKYRKSAADWISAMEVDEDHMSSLFTLALICDAEPSEDVKRALKKVKFHKDFKFMLRGWADLAVMVVDLKNDQVYSNPKGKKTAQNFLIPDKT